MFAYLIFRPYTNCCDLVFFQFLGNFISSDAENEDDDADENENDENMDTAEADETRPQNPDDEYNFADYDNEGAATITTRLLKLIRIFKRYKFQLFPPQRIDKWQR